MTKCLALAACLSLASATFLSTSLASEVSEYGPHRIKSKIINGMSIKTRYLEPERELDEWLVEFNPPSVLTKYSQKSDSVSYFVAKKSKAQLNVQEYEHSIIESQQNFFQRFDEKANVEVKQYLSKVINGTIVSAEEATIRSLRLNPSIKRITRATVVKKQLDASVDLISVPDLWQRRDALNQSITGKGVTVAVIDTGVDFNHPDLGGCFGEGCKVSSGYDFVDNDAIPEDVDGHGTHVAGIIAANGTLRGVAPDANIMAIKALNDDGFGSSFDIIRGIEYAVDPDGDVNTDDGADIINLSLGGQGSPTDPISTAVDAAVSAGVVVVAAAGNDGSYGDIANFSPASSRAAITVGSIDPDGSLSSFSSKGPAVGGDTLKPEVLAPGGNIKSLAVGSGEVTLSGTSMAAPHVAGVAALLKQALPEITPIDIKARLISSAKDLGLDPFAQGYGLVDALGALEQDILITTANVFFGKFNQSLNGTEISRDITVKNASDQAQTVELTLPTDLPEQVQWQLSQDTLSLAAGSSATVQLTAQLDSIEDIPYPEDLSGSYYSPLTVSGETSNIDLPVSFQRSLLLTITHDNPFAIDISVDSAAGDSIAWNAVGPDTDEELFVSPGRYYITIDHFFDIGYDTGIEGIPSAAEAGLTVVNGLETYVVDITEDTTIFSSVNNLTHVIGTTGRENSDAAFDEIYTVSDQLFNRIDGEGISISYNSKASWNTSIPEGQLNVYYVLGNISNDIESKLSLLHKTENDGTEEIHHYWAQLNDKDSSDFYSITSSNAQKLSVNSIHGLINETREYGFSIFGDLYEGSLIPLQLTNDTFDYFVASGSDTSETVVLGVVQKKMDLVSEATTVFSTPQLLFTTDIIDRENYDYDVLQTALNSSISLMPSPSTHSNGFELWQETLFDNQESGFVGLNGSQSEGFDASYTVECNGEEFSQGRLTRGALGEANIPICNTTEIFLQSSVDIDGEVSVTEVVHSSSADNYVLSGLYTQLVDDMLNPSLYTNIGNQLHYLLIAPSRIAGSVDNLRVRYGFDDGTFSEPMAINDISGSKYLYQVELPPMNIEQQTVTLEFYYETWQATSTQTITNALRVGVDLDSETEDFDGDGIVNALDNDNDNDGLPDTYERANGLNLLDEADALEDLDGDGLTNLEEYGLGTSINNADTDGDGVPDGLDSSPLGEDNVLLTGEINVLGDINNNGVNDISIVRRNESGTFSVQMFDSENMSVLRDYEFTVNYQPSGFSSQIMSDVNGDGIAELGVFGVRADDGNEGRAQFQIIDITSGIALSTYNWPASWENMQTVLLNDLNNDGSIEIGLQGDNINNGRKQLVVRDGATRSAYQTFSYPSIFNDSTYNHVSDLSGDNIDDIGFSGTLRRNGRAQVRVVDATDSTNRLRSFNFANNWVETSWHRLSDSDGDDIDDWGLFGIRADNGRPQLIQKSGANPRGILRIHSWAEDLVQATFIRVKDMNNDGVDELAVFGLRSESNRYQLNIKDGVERSLIVANFGWPNRWSEASAHILPDLTNDGVSEVALLGVNESGDWEIVVRDGESRIEITRENLGNNWEERPKLLEVGDSDFDGISNILAVGQSHADESRIERLFESL